MWETKLTEGQIISMLKDAEGGRKVNDICQESN
jgi:hypothetical protein